MRKCVLAGAASLAMVAAPAFAADLPVYKAPPAPVTNWTGVYAGVNAGGAWVKAPLEFIAGSPTPADAAALSQAGTVDLKGSAFVGGVQAGFNWQSGPALLGVEVDFNAFRAELQQGPTTFPYGSNPALTFVMTQNVTTNWLLTVRPRVGFVANSALVYATAGLAVTDLHYSVSVIDALGSSETGTSLSKTKTGWTAGGGIEVLLSNNWSAKAEYLHVEFGSKSVVGSAGPGGLNTHNVKLNADIARLGLNYRLPVR